jgi:hypothetical protein
LDLAEMSIQPVRREATLLVGDDDEPFDVVSRALRPFNSRQILDSAGAHEWEVGSRASFRVWGLWGWNVDKRLPFVVSAALQPGASGQILTLRLASAEGPYLTRLSAVDRAYARLFESLIASISDLLT